jgi:hypothetical protein
MSILMTPPSRYSHHRWFGCCAGIKGACWQVRVGWLVLKSGRD